MKTISILVCFSTVILLLSCKKEETRTESVHNFGFTGNSVNYRWDFTPAPSMDLSDAYFVKTVSPNTNDTMFVLVGVNQSSNIRLECAIHTSSLRASVYRTVTSMSDMWVESTCLIKGQFYGTRTDDLVTVTITNIDRNFASGTFGAVMHDLAWGGLQEFRIWNGYFNHVEIPQ